MPEMTGKVRVKRVWKERISTQTNQIAVSECKFLDFAVSHTRSNLKSAEKGAFLHKKTVQNALFLAAAGYPYHR